MSVAKGWLRATGALLSIACTIWVGWRFAQSGVLLRVMRSPQACDLGLRVALAIPVYATGTFLLGVGWWCLQRALSPVWRPMKATLLPYAVTQFGKYLPGNVAQYVGRHVWMRRHGLSHGTLVGCALGEAALLVGASLIWSAWLLPGKMFVWLAWIVAIVGVVVSATLLRALRWRSIWLANRIDQVSPGWVTAAFGTYVVFFGLMALTLLMVAGMHRAPLPLLAAAAAVSWAAGYFVIGAPAGLGVREAAFVSLLAGKIPENEVLLMVAAFRVATFGGDLLVFMAALPFARREAK